MLNLLLTGSIIGSILLVLRPTDLVFTPAEALAVYVILGIVFFFLAEAR